MRSYLVPSKIDFGFRQTPKSFFVEEIPARSFGQKGRYAILKVQKEGLSTWEMVKILGSFLQERQIGYAGLKDKNATTIQYLSLPASHLRRLAKFSHPRIQILQTWRSNTPLRMGDLLGNRFGIWIDRIDTKRFGQLQKALDKIAHKGLPNYFGYQRFGQNALEQARALIEGEFFTRDKKLERMLLFAYQSDLFNRWLDERVRMSENGRFKLLEGDIYQADSKLFTPTYIPLEDFLAKKIMITGLLPGSKAYRARAEARKVEEKYDEHLPLLGQRRAALVYPNSIKTRHIKKRAHLEFILPKASYATILLENLAGKQIDYKGLA